MTTAIEETNYLIEKTNLTGIVNFLKENQYKKKTGKEIGAEDVQNYIRRGELPKHMGNVKIEPCKEITCVKLYNLKKVV